MAQVGPAIYYLLDDETSPNAHGPRRGYSNIVGDHGGETFDGISRNNWDQWEGWKIIDGLKSDPNFPACLDTNAPLRQLVAQFYEANFWRPSYNGIDSQQVASKLFDHAVNMGSVRAVKLLQGAISDCGLETTADGVFGLKTLTNLNIVHPGDLIPRYVGRLVAFYRECALNDPTQRKFIDGWLARARRLPPADQEQT